MDHAALYISAPNTAKWPTTETQVHSNAKEWIALAKATGMKYLVITAKHYDGFAMYHSQVSKYNIVDWTPFKRIH